MKYIMSAVFSNHAGLILADSANMGMRIAYSWVFIRKDMQHLTVPRWWPSWPSCAACIAAAITAGKLV